MRQSVSLTMIVRNEEQNLAECLTPVAHLFDEIVIVDTGSQDATVEIARRFTPHVHFFEWCDDFAAARNAALKHATGEWIFWLDADDRLDAENVERLSRLLGSLNEQPQAFMFAFRRIAHRGRPCGARCAMKSPRANHAAEDDRVDPQLPGGPRRSE